MKTRQTNVEFLTELMEFAASGPLLQCFVLDALEKHADAVVASEAELRESMKDSFVTPEAWIACAREIQAEFAERRSEISKL